MVVDKKYSLALYANGIMPFSEKAETLKQFFKFSQKGSKVFCDDVKLDYSLYSWYNEYYGRSNHSIFLESLFELNTSIETPNYYRILMCTRAPNSIYVAPTQFITPHNILNQVFLDKLYWHLVGKVTNVSTPLQHR